MSYFHHKSPWSTLCQERQVSWNKLLMSYILVYSQSSLNGLSSNELNIWSPWQNMVWAPCLASRGWVLYLSFVSLAAIFFSLECLNFFCNWLQLWLYYCHWTNTAHCFLGHFSKSKIWGIHKCFLSWWMEQLQTLSLSVDVFILSIVLRRHFIRKWLQYWDTTSCFDPNHCLFCCDFHGHVYMCCPWPIDRSAAIQDYTALTHCNFLNHINIAF